MKALFVASFLAIFPASAFAQAGDGAGTNAPETDRQKEVLVLYSTRRDAQIVTVGERELPQILEEGVPEGIDYYSEFLDQGRFLQSDYRKGYRDFLALKFRERRFDLVIAMGEVPLRFLTANRSALFGDAPILYFTDRPVERPPNATGVVSELNLAGTLALATELQPDLQQVFVVVGAGNDAMRRSAEEQFRPFQPRLAITFLSGLRTADLEARLASLPPHSAVYYLVVDRDGDNINFHPLEYLDRVTAVSSAPVYSWVDSALDRGIVGGSLKNQVAQTRTVAALALRVLRGEAADSIAPYTTDLNVKEVDWRQLSRWGLSESRLPLGTIVRYREPSVWDRYGVAIAGALILMVAQSGLIAGLLVHRRRRQQAETLVARNQADLRRSYNRIRDLASRLLDAQEQERSRIARDLHDDISQQMALLKIDLEQLNNIVDGPASELTHETLERAQSIARSVHDLSHRLHPAKLRLIGLVSALQGLRRELSQPNLDITFSHENVPPALPEELALCLFRIVQEALQNAIKYSHGHHVTVDLRGSDDELTLTVADDGVGFDVATTWRSGIGLISMHERLEAVGGSLTIDSKPGAGTRLQVAVPLPVDPDAVPAA
jgi:signal transduction histidine kinase